MQGSSASNLQIEQLRPADVQRKLADGWDPLLIDVREAREREISALPEDRFETLAIPLGQLAGALPALLRQIPPERPLLCLCHHGIRSWHAACMITHESERNRPGTVCNLAGGIDAWSMDVDPAIPRY